MADIYIKQANGGETTTPTGDEGLPVDDGATSTWIAIKNLIIRKLRETSGPTTLSMGAIADGKILKRSGSSIIGDIFDGWTEVSGTWTYATANTINVPSGAASIYKKGMGIRWKQGGGYKYGYITVVADTLLTVTGGTDYTVANSAITDVAYTITPATAIGHPVTFNYTPTFSRSGTAFTNSPTVNSASFQLDGNLITGSINFTMPASAGGTGEIYASPPTTITTGMADFGIEIAATAAAFSIAASSSGQVFNFYDIYPVAVISTTSGRNYVGRFRYGI